ncbi:AEC family transporter [Terricaulis sp.]|uniref:AEC family transporter n=1 Tax=Terricaulis sp. TaxID=2768686 RepID=UPI003783C0C1
MSEVIAELLPVFILIMIGYGVRAAGIVTAEGFGQINRFGYFVLYPAFLFALTSTADLAAADAGAFVLGLVVGFAALFVIALSLRPLIRADGPAFTSVVQGSVRWNSFVLLAAAPALYGPQGPHFIGIAFGPLVLLVNLVCVLVLARWGTNGANSPRAIVDQIVANPLILACAAGLLAQLLHVRASGGVETVIGLLANAAMPIALVCVGAGLDFKAVRAARVRVGVASVLKLIVAPAVLWGAATLVGATPMAAAVAAGVGSTPTAAAGYTLAREMGGDAELMAAIITATTIFSFLTMPIAIGLALH